MSITRTTAAIAADIKIAHSVFALPFAILAAFMAAAPVGARIDWPRLGGQLGLVVLAMIFARTAAMAANRVLDREIDRHNPRTAGRAIPSGRISPRAMIAALVAGSLGFILVCAAFGIVYGNWWPTALALPVLAWITAYALVKRYSALCHLYLGSSLALSPIAAALAVDPAALEHQPAVWLLGGMVVGWVAGFDVIYALQDLEVDRAQGLRSIPARFGGAGAIAISRVLHGIAIACLVAAARIDVRLGVLFAIGVAVVAALLVGEQATVRRWGTTRMAIT
ncbi:MAG: 4-hydroxybenzoate octaprenyltransferase, partial [Planctomycetota bacterium]